MHWMIHIIPSVVLLIFVQLAHIIVIFQIDLMWDKSIMFNQKYRQIFIDISTSQYQQQKNMQVDYHH